MTLYTTSAPDQSHCHLLAIPAEIRTNIYEFVARSQNEVISPYSKTDPVIRRLPVKDSATVFGSY